MLPFFVCVHLHKCKYLFIIDVSILLFIAGHIKRLSLVSV